MSTSPDSVQRFRHAWWKDAVAYQIYPRSFMDSNGDGIGDLPGILARLDYLQWLGIDVIWICPIYRSPNDDNGYDVSDYQAIMAEFGTMADFDRLLSEVHRRGMRLILDLVLNHTSDEHAWFVESRESPDSPRRDWYIWRDGKAGDKANDKANDKAGGPPNNWESIFGGPAWELDEASGQYFLHLFSRRQPDLNWECAPMREALYGMVRWWLDKGIDGFRLDAVSHIRKAPGLPDMPNPKGLAQVPCFPLHMNVDGVLGHLDALCEHTFRHYDVMTVGEANGVGPAEAVEWVGERRRRLDMIFQFEHLALWSANPRAGLDVAGLKRVFGAWQKALAGQGWNALFIENHDIPRVVSLWGDVEHHWRDSATALATVYFLLQGTPFIYQGQEIGMTNTVFDGIADFDDVLARNRWQERVAAGEHPADVLADLSITARDNARTPMQWSAAPGAGFTTGKPWLKPNPNHAHINVAAQEADPDSVLNYYRRLIALRKAERVLVEGAYHPLMASHRQIYAYCRGEGAGRLVVIVNLGKRPARYCHAGLMLAHEGLLLANLPVAPHAPRDTLQLQPYEARVYRVAVR